MPKRRRDLPGGRVSTRRELAEAFKVAETTVNAWLAKGAPGAVDGVYDIVALSEWRAQQANGRNDAGEDSSKQRIERAKAEMAEMELAERRGELIPRADVDRENLARIVVLRNALLALPRQICPKLEGLEVREMMVVMKKRIEELLDDFAAQDP